MDTGNNSQYLVINHNGRECEKDTNIYVKLNHLSVPRNPHIVNQLYFNLKSKERKKEITTWGQKSFQASKIWL